jgi:hypothetical protein
VGAVWPGDQPEHPFQALQVLVSRDRARLGHGVIVSTPGGHRLDLREDQIDASAVLLGASESEKRSRASDHLAALGHAEARLALFVALNTAVGEVIGHLSASTGRQTSATSPARSTTAVRIDSDGTNVPDRSAPHGGELRPELAEARVAVC